MLGGDLGESLEVQRPAGIYKTSLGSQCQPALDAEAKRGGSSSSIAGTRARTKARVAPAATIAAASRDASESPPGNLQTSPRDAPAIFSGSSKSLPTGRTHGDPKAHGHLGTTTDQKFEGVFMGHWEDPWGPLLASLIPSCYQAVTRLLRAVTKLLPSRYQVDGHQKLAIVKWSSG